MPPPLLHQPAPSERGSKVAEVLKAGLEGTKVAEVLKAQTDKGYTALHLAAKHTDADTAKVLLGWGADPTAKCKQGKSVVEMVGDDDDGAAVLRDVITAALRFLTSLSST